MSMGSAPGLHGARVALCKTPTRMLHVARGPGARSTARWSVRSVTHPQMGRSWHGGKARPRAAPAYVRRRRRPRGAALVFGLRWQ